MTKISKIIIIFSTFFYLLSMNSFSKVITKLPSDSKNKLIALTFDACETRTPSFFDLKILDYLLKTKTPFTIFVSGKFAKRNINALILKSLSTLDFIEIENHSYYHRQHMEKLSKKEIITDLSKTDNIIIRMTHRHTKFFRFPAGNYDKKSLAVVESLGYKVVHWSFASGDPDKHITPPRLIKWVLYKTKPNSILIFHINGRGYSTSRALPSIVSALKKRGYRFVKIDSVIK